jgi:hypothetical protein
MAGKPAVFGGQQPGHIGTFINNGTLNVAGYANGAELRAYGVAVFNGTIEEFQNLSGGRIEVYGNNTGGNATVYGVGAFRGTWWLWEFDQVYECWINKCNSYW